MDGALLIGVICVVVVFWHIFALLLKLMFAAVFISVLAVGVSWLVAPAASNEEQEKDEDDDLF